MPLKTLRGGMDIEKSNLPLPYKYITFAYI